MIPLVDADILRYEIGFAAEVGWRAITEREDAIPPFDYVSHMLGERLRAIGAAVNATEKAELYLTEGKGFRDAIAVTKPYKGTRKGNKPWHFNNLSAYMKGPLEANVSFRGLEADDVLAMRQLLDPENTIICTRDKDLRQVPGWSYSWELGDQPGFGPVKIDPLGDLELTRKDGRPPKLRGTGYKWFAAQMLTGDSVDNVPGCPKVGPVLAHETLEDCASEAECMEAVEALYDDRLGAEAEDRILEMGRLLWMVRRLNTDGTPEMWEPGLEK